MKNLLFIVKKRATNYKVSFGLINSAKFTAEMLNENLPNNINAKVVEVIDNNGIEKEVVQHKANFVFIEAIWVVPDKIELLAKRYPKVIWVIRNHSKVPFLANEGIAFNWIKEYNELEKKYTNVFFSSNSIETNNALNKTFLTHNVCLPNIYYQKERKIKETHSNSEIHIGCFGAIRPMKNHLQQALVAIKFARDINKHLYFHINSGRVEQQGEQVLKNLRNIFAANQNGATLIEHGWLNHDDFLQLVCNMDIGMQVSLSESFNIVTADFINQNVPIVVSQDIDWMPCLYQADPNSFNDIYNTLKFVYKTKFLGLHNWLNKDKLENYTIEALYKWIEFIEC